MFLGLNMVKFKFYKFIKKKLLSLNASTYDEALKIKGNQFTENIVIENNNFQFTFTVDEYPDEDEIVIVGYLYRKRILCDESYSLGYKFNKENLKSYLSQKALWDFGY